jgi:hypothetical protein
MPQYIYKNLQTEEIREIFQSMKEEHIYLGESGDEKDWIRIFAVPQMTFDSFSSLDPYSQKDFNKFTETKAGTYGDVMDASNELSEKRAQKDGKDPIKEKYFRDYEKKTHAKHPKSLPTKFEKNGVTVDLND